MITEDYCSPDLAQTLQEKAKELFEYYHLADDEKTGLYKTVTHQRAMKWLRVVHKLTFIISPQWAEGDMRNPCRWYWEVKGLRDTTTDMYSNPLCDSYEEAVEAALKYSLENMV